MENDEKNNQNPKLKSCKKFDKKITQNKIDLKQELSTIKKFIEYFFIIGLDPKYSIESFLYNSSIDDLHNYYSNVLKPEIITKYPPINKSYINIDDNLPELCFPDGFKLEKYETQPEPDKLKFLLGNYYYSIDFPLKYVTCLKIYENLENYQNLQSKLKKFFGKAFFNFKNSSKSIIVNNSFQDEDDDNFRKTKNITSTKNIQDIFISNDDNKIKKSDFNKYYFPKVIGFVSLKPFYKYHEKILYQIYQYYYKNNTNKFKIPLEKTILNILHNIPMPPRGLNIYQYQIDENYEKINIKSEKMNKLKNIDEDLEVIFKYFSVDNFIEIFKYTLYETKTIIFGTNANHLCSFVNGLISIIYPFIYPFQVSSSVHKNAFEILESISPYIIGVNQKLTDNFFSENKIEIKGSNYIIIDLDNKEFSLNLIEDVPNIPKNLIKRLKTKIDTNFKKYVKSKFENKLKNNENLLINENEENWICYAFFDFFLGILYNYGDYLNNDNLKKNYKISSLKILFKIKEFIDSHSSNERSFYKKLVETQMFNDFIFKKMIPKDINDKLEILFFDEHINKKNNKKIFTKNKPIIYLNSKEYDYKEIHKVPKLTGLSIREKKRYTDKSYILNNLVMGQEIIYEKYKNYNDDKAEEDNNNKINNNNEDNEGEYYFNYVLFPKFNKDFFNDPAPEYTLYKPIIGDINRINTDLLAKSHRTSGEIVENNEGMLDYIYLTYIEVWGYSYWYQDIVERDYRFEQMLEALDKIKHHEIELINVLFESLNKFQEKEKIMRLYNKILEYNINPNSFIYSIVGKIVQKMPDNPDIFLGIKSNDKENFPRRTFRTEDETNILGDYISFNYIQKCPDCNKLIDIENICREHKKMKKDLYWAKCPFCNYIKPEIIVNFGNSMTSKNLYVPCSKSETFTLCSPYELKNSLKEIIDKEKFHLLDIDKFKMKFPNLFWSCIWYFHLYDLDFNIMLPYEVNIFKQKSNPNGINLHYINSKIYPKFKKNYDDIEINENKIIINNNKNINLNENNNLFIIQNIFSFCIINNICYDYFGILKKYTKEVFEIKNNNNNDYLKGRTKSFMPIMNKNKTISSFLKSGGDKKISDKKINEINTNDFNKTPNMPTRKQNKKFEFKKLEDIKLKKVISQNAGHKQSFNDDIKEINEIKPINILSSSTNNEIFDNRKSGNSSSMDSD